MQTYTSILEKLQAIDQLHLISHPQASEEDLIARERMLEELQALDSFYAPIGGIIGYHQLCLKRLKEKAGNHPVTLRHFPGPDLSQMGEELSDTGLKAFASSAELYPMGGFATRLKLSDQNNRPLPIATLELGGKTLLQRLFDDLEAREHLFYETFGQRLCTPVAIMLSQEPHFKERILELFEELHWFGRPKKSIFFFFQPLVPLIDKEGRWKTDGPFSLVKKPGGHGVIWKAAADQGVFTWLKQQQRRYLLVRQLNNVAPGMDHTLLSFLGYGALHHKEFGFLSCSKLPLAAEGVLGCVEEKEIATEKPSYTYRLANVEYTDFQERGIEDGAHHATNVNLLFATLEGIEKKLESSPFPGLIVNTTKADQEGVYLESCMQNLSESWNVTAPTAQPIEAVAEQLPLFILYQERQKAISTAKRATTPTNPLFETPQGAFFDLFQLTYRLLKECGVELPLLPTAQELLNNGIPFSFLFHPVLGPAFKRVAKKIHGGRLEQGAFVHLELADLLWENVQVEGALKIASDRPYLGRCFLKNVLVKNQAPFNPHTAWQGKTPPGGVEIFLHGSGELIAENLTLQGALTLHVQDQERVTLSSEGESGSLLILREACLPV